MKAKLLLIDDSEAQSNQIQEALARLGYQVTRASSGMEGLRLARSSSPDLILLDVVMADIDGFAVCRWLKMNAETRDIPVIMLTVRSALADRVEGLNIGADDYLAKPFADEELEARIFAALRVKAAHAELRGRNQELESMLHSVEALASTDALTGLFNRRRFADVLKREFAVTKRYRNTLSCLLLDLDHFKQINDRFGHDAGDQVLKEVGRRITSTLREVDLAARYGGEEFVVLLPHTSKTDARILAERLLQNVRRQAFQFGDELVTVTTSIGCAGNSDVVTDNAEDLVKAADIALYQAKNSGRNCAVMYSPGSEGRTVGTQSSRPAPAMPSRPAPAMAFPASQPAPAGPFTVALPGEVRLPGAPPSEASLGGDAAATPDPPASPKRGA